ncbi:hypothetical protein LCD49_14305 [Enterobacter kobei]|nr:hypothetical protein LCD49_14305 [Enterobacter kobei]
MPVSPFVGQFALSCSRFRPAMTSLCRRSMVSFASASSPVYLASSAATSRWRTFMSSMVFFARLRFSIALSRWSL